MEFYLLRLVPKVPFRQDSKLYLKFVKLLCTSNLHMCLNVLLKPKEANLEEFFSIYFIEICKIFRFSAAVSTGHQKDTLFTLLWNHK